MRKLKNSELKRVSINEFKSASKTPIVIILDNVRSLNNIGSIFRTADAFLIEAVYLCGITACPPHKDIQKTALGATETVNWKYFKNTIEAVDELKEKSYLVFAIEQTENSVFLDQFQPTIDQGIALVFGNEINGVEQDVINECNGCIEIPQYGSKHSLNIAVCAGILIWDLFNKIRK
jgi:23S rRNA (guanosine2251-2'-O)-methyltransferase